MVLENSTNSVVLPEDRIFENMNINIVLEKLAIEKFYIIIISCIEFYLLLDPISVLVWMLFLLWFSYKRVVIYPSKRHILCLPTTNLSMLFSDRRNIVCLYWICSICCTSFALLTEMKLYLISWISLCVHVHTLNVFV